MVTYEKVDFEKTDMTGLSSLPSSFALSRKRVLSWWKEDRILDISVADLVSRNSKVFQMKPRKAMEKGSTPQWVPATQLQVQGDP